jgi:NAD(P)H-flavin reductase
MLIKIILRKTLSEHLFKLEIKPSGTFNPIKAGQYIILRVMPGGSAVTVPVIKTDPTRGTLTVIVSSASESLSALLNPCLSGIQFEMEGPFGQPFGIENFGAVLCVASFDCMVPLYPVLAALRIAGNHISCLLTGVAGNNQVIESEIRTLSDNWIAGDENQRRLSQILEQTLRAQKFDQVFVVGPAKTVRETCTICTATRTPVQAMLFLNEKNQGGQHGIFRVSVCGNTRALCVDGYNFNAYYTTYEEMVKRFGCEAPANKINIPA